MQNGVSTEIPLPADLHRLHGVFTLGPGAPSRSMDEGS
jgi:hypothetical protein